MAPQTERRQTDQDGGEHGECDGNRHGDDRRKFEEFVAVRGRIGADPKVKAVLFNIFGGITRCDEVARGILAALQTVETDVPMVARLVGTNEEEGRQILAAANFPSAASLGEAAEKAVALAKGA